MRTPREILLQRHQAAVPRLNALRAKALAQLDTTPPARFTTHDRTPSWRLLWEGLFLPARTAWSLLAVLGLAALALHGATPREYPSPPRAALHPPVSPLEASRERARLLADLGESRGTSAHPTAPPDPEPPSPSPSPSSSPGKRRSAIPASIWAV